MPAAEPSPRWVTKKLRLPLPAADLLACPLARMDLTSRRSSLISLRQSVTGRTPHERHNGGPERGRQRGGGESRQPNEHNVLLQDAAILLLGGLGVLGQLALQGLDLQQTERRNMNGTGEGRQGTNSQPKQMWCTNRPQTRQHKLTQQSKKGREGGGGVGGPASLGTLVAWCTHRAPTPPCSPSRNPP